VLEFGPQAAQGHGRGQAPLLHRVLGGVPLHGQHQALHGHHLQLEFEKVDLRGGEGGGGRAVAGAADEARAAARPPRSNAGGSKA
jgi:hypothetical protein